jgi:hypothetical protein
LKDTFPVIDNDGIRDCVQCIVLDDLGCLLAMIR